MLEPVGTHHQSSHSLHFTNDKGETRKDEETCPRSHSRKAWGQNVIQALWAHAPTGVGSAQVCVKPGDSASFSECSTLGALRRRGMRSAKACFPGQRNCMLRASGSQVPKTTPKTFYCIPLATEKSPLSTGGWLKVSMALLFK